MGVSRVGNLALYNTTMKGVADVQRQLATLQEQISSGIKAKDFAGLAGQVEQFTLLEAKMRSAAKFQDSNSLNIARMKTADQALGQMVDIADSMENLIVQMRSGAVGDSVEFPLVMRGYLDQLQGSLNMSLEGRYLFGGTNTANVPVPDIQNPPTVMGIASAEYYAGSSTNIVYKSDERSEYTFPVRADDPSFQKIITAAHMAITASESNNDDLLRDALNMMQAGQAELNTARARTNHTIINLESSNENLAALSLYWKGVTEQVAKTDMVAASTEVAQHEATLQAAFSVFSRLSQLRLTDYL